MNMNKAKGSTVPLVYQDMISNYNSSANDNGEDIDVSLGFFELANAPLVAYRLSLSSLSHSVSEQAKKSSDKDEQTDTVSSSKPSKKRPRRDDREHTCIVIGQDVSACGQHTGGIVWETSYLLLEYLLYQHQQWSKETTTKKKSTYLGRVLEVGAGCGMLGLVLAATPNCCDQVVVSEAPAVVTNLQANVARNASQVCSPLTCCTLDWTTYKSDMEQTKVLQQPFDTIVGTDVLFKTSLVVPLLQTLQATSHPQSLILLCVQIRCPNSHRLFLDRAKHFDLHVCDSSQEWDTIPNCKWGAELDCKLLRVTKQKATSNKS